MKKKWKYANNSSLHNRFGTMIFIWVFLFSSCNNNEKHEHVADKNVKDLDGLVLPVNQTVYSMVRTTVPQNKTITPILNANGIITYNSQLINNISARFSGRIDKLYVRFNFQEIIKGQRILDIYSPEILTEQHNLIFLLSDSSGNLALIQLSKQKLRLLGLTDEQLDKIETSKRPINPLPIYSAYTGHIHDLGIKSGVSSTASSMSKDMNNSSTASSDQLQIENIPSSITSSLSIKEGMYLQSGQPIFSIYDISQVWAVLNIYQRDASYIKTGDVVYIISETRHDDTIRTHINYIEPVTGQNASTIKARVYLTNSDNLNLKIGTLLSAKILSSEITGMWLPRNAVVNVGKKQVVFIKANNNFTAKEIQTGYETDSLIEVITGLKGKEQLAENAQYLVDSESFIKTAK